MQSFRKKKKNHVVIAKALIPSLLELGLVEANSNKQNKFQAHD
jgi:hypothetical protein